MTNHSVFMCACKSKNKITYRRYPSVEPELIQAGDWTSLGKLLEQYYDDLFEAAEAILKSPQDAEDVVQQAILKALKQFCKFRGEADYYTYLVRIVINESRNLIRRNRLVRKARRIPQTIRVIRDPGEIMESKIILQLTVDCINSLSPGMKKVLYLRFIKNLSYLEIASALSCSPGTVKSRLARGRKLLQSKLLDLQIVDSARLPNLLKEEDAQSF